MDYRHTDPDSTTSSWNSNNQTSNYNNNSNLHSSLKDRDDGYSGFKKNDSDNTHDYHSGWSSQHNENSYTYEKHPSSSTSKYEESTSRSSLSENMNVNNPVVANDLKKKEQQGKQHAEDIFTKTKKVLRQKWGQTLQTVQQVNKKVVSMAPPGGKDLIYWKRPIHSGMIFGTLLSLIITFMFLSSLAAISFWLLALLIIIGLHKLYNYVMITFLGREHEDMFNSLVPPDVNVSFETAQSVSNFVRINGTKTLKMARHLFLWENLTQSLIFGFVLFAFFYIGLSMNALTLALVVLIFSFTVPKVYQVYQAPIDRTAKNSLDKMNQLLATITSKLPSGAKAKKP